MLRYTRISIPKMVMFVVASRILKKCLIFVVGIRGWFLGIGVSGLI